MTADEFNALTRRIAKALEAEFATVTIGLEADAEGTLPEIYLDAGNSDVCLTIGPI